VQRARSALNGAWQGMLDWVYPRHCCHCEAPLHQQRGRWLCAGCSRHLEAQRICAPLCARCGLPLAGAPAPGTLCTTCRLEERQFDRARAFVAYGGPAASLVKAFKFQGDYFLGPALLRAMVERGWMPTNVGRPDCVVPIPLHARRRRERGYDQALLLGREVARQMGVPLVGGALVRARYTSQQSLLPVRSRWDNVRGAFRVARPGRVAGRNILLVDDVLTTGVTASECARALKKAGATQVAVLTLARTAP